MNAQFKHFTSELISLQSTIFTLQTEITENCVHFHKAYNQFDTIITNLQSKIDRLISQIDNLLDPFIIQRIEIGQSDLSHSK